MRGAEGLSGGAMAATGVSEGIVGVGARKGLGLVSQEIWEEMHDQGQGRETEGAEEVVEGSEVTEEVVDSGGIEVVVAEVKEGSEEEVEVETEKTGRDILGH